MVLGYGESRNMHQSIRPLPLASPISPVFVRRREDKSVRSFDLRRQQVADVVEVPMMGHGVCFGKQIERLWDAMKAENIVEG